MKLFTNISIGVKTFYGVAAACIGLTVAGWIGHGAYQSFMGQFDVVLDSIAVVQENVHYINVEQSFMAKDIEALHDTLEDMNEGIERNAQTAERLIWIERNREGFSPEQLEMLLDDWLKKNSELNCLTGQINFDNITMTESQILRSYP